MTMICYKEFFNKCLPIRSPHANEYCIFVLGWALSKVEHATIHDFLLLITPKIETTIEIRKNPKVSAPYHCYFLQEKHF